MNRERRTHKLRHNKQSRQPRRHVFIDTEARIDYRKGIQTQRWRLGVARFLDADTRRAASVVYDREYLESEALWNDVSEFTRSGTRTVVWAHNLAYDLRISEAFHHLPRMGWSLRSIVMDGMACWARFTRGKASLVCTDLTSWVNQPLAVVGSYVNLGQEPLPVDPDDTRGLFKRCGRDVEILATAVIEILDWIEREDLGNWQLTGAGQAASAFRHRFMTHKMLVHDDERTLAVERRAIWAGRTETWKHGVYDDVDAYEYDLHAAYATISRDYHLPAVFLGTLPQCSLSHYRVWRKSRRILAECRVTTERPIVPTEHDGRVIWPAGTFRTTLWDCELDLLLEHGAKVRLYRTHIYQPAPVLRAWAEWILPQIDPTNPDTPQLQRRILKSWSRSLIGRFSLRYRQWSDTGTSSEFDLNLSRLVGKREAKGAQIMQVGHDLLELGTVVEHDNSMPQITGYVTAVCRVRLWNLIQIAGEGNVYYMDTDSLIVSADGARNLESEIRRTGAYGLLRKRHISRLELGGPRNLSVDRRLRVSGVPRKAQKVRTGEFMGEAWEGLGEAIASGRAGSVLVYERTFRLAAEDKRRRWLDNGETEPYTLPHGEHKPPP